MKEERWRCTLAWVTDEQRDELMRRRVNAKKVEERAALIGVYVNSLIMKTKNCCSCSEGFVLLMQREQRQSCTCVHLRAPVCVCVCVWRCKTKCVAFLPPYQWHAHWLPRRLLFDWSPSDERARALFPKWPRKRSTTKWLFFFCFFFIASVWCTSKVPSPHLGHFPAAEIA